MSKGQYATLNVVFGLVAVFAGIAYNDYRKGWVFLIAAGFALGVGGGEAIALEFILKEMAFQGSLPAGSTVIAQLALAAVWVLITLLAVKRVVR